MSLLDVLEAGNMGGEGEDGVEERGGLRVGEAAEGDEGVVFGPSRVVVIICHDDGGLERGVCGATRNGGGKTELL